MSRPYSQSAAATAPGSGAHVASLLRQAVLYHIDNLSHDSALFFAERLLAQEPKSPDSTFLLALCHFHRGDFLSAYETSKDDGSKGAFSRNAHLGRVFVFAQSCLALERHQHGALALEKSRPQWPQKPHLGKHTTTTRSLTPDAATLSCLLGKLYRGMDDKKRAASCFEDALKLNPLMWDAFTSLCDMGITVKVPNIFRVSDAFVRSLEQESCASADSKDASSQFQIPAEQPLPRKSAMRSVHAEPPDPFDHQPRSTAFQDKYSYGNNLMTVETEENDLIAKIAAARSRMAASAGPSPNSAIMETPPAPPSATDLHASRAGQQNPDPPQAPVRKNRVAQVAEPSFLDAAPPRMGYRATSKRKDPKGGLDVAGEPPPGSDAAGPSLLRSSTASLSGADRKRTLSGQPVHPRQAQAGEEPGAPPRRSTRLNMTRPATSKPIFGTAVAIGSTATREMKKARPAVSRIMRPGSSGSTVGRAVSGNRKPVEEHGGMDADHVEPPSAPTRPPREAAQQQPPTPRPAEIEDALRFVLDLLRRLGSGYLSLSQFQLSEAIQSFSSVPRAHADTPWVLAQTGRAQFEQAKYADAEASFRRLRALAPNRLEDMEVYSTVLWHLKKETDLSFLAHELVDSAWHSPHAWCALGNAWSLASDREQALQCFKRATQLDPKFAYAYTLQGHEHQLNEEYDKALTAYRHAISADRRHYNAYYGIGKVYEKLGNYDKAYTHYHAASAIHPTNAVLICCIGQALEKQKHVVQALQFFTKAIELAPQAALTRYNKARALMNIGQLEEARRELMVLKDLTPDEATVHFLLGKLYKSLGDRTNAVHHFTIALSLDPKASQLIKKAIESLEDEEGFDDSMMQ